MPAFYSPEWVAAFNRAVEGLEDTETAAEHSVTASSGTYRVVQLLDDAPDGALAVTLTVEDGACRMEVAERSGSGELPPANVTVTLSYADAAALSRGELDPAEALARGLIRVRGDLAVLVASQAVLTRAAGRLADLQAATTY